MIDPILVLWGFLDDASDLENGQVGLGAIVSVSFEVGEDGGRFFSADCEGCEG